MKIFARIDGNKVGSTQEIDDGADIYDYFDHSQLWIDITNVIPAPAYGWSYVDGVFSEPVPEPEDPRPGILAELVQIDLDSARPIRTLIVSAPDIGVGTPERAEIEALEARAVILRAQLEALDT